MKIIKRFFSPVIHFFIYYFTNYLISYFPFRFVRSFWLYLLGLRKGKKSFLDMGIYFLAPWNLSIGKNSHVNRGCFIDARGKIKIGNSVSVSHNVSLITGSHNINSEDFKYEAKSIEIGNYCFVGANSTILQDVRVGNYAVICAGTVVTKDVDDYAIVAGIPAKVIGYRNQNTNFSYECNPNAFFV